MRAKFSWLNSNSLVFKSSGSGPYATQKISLRLLAFDRIPSNRCQNHRKSESATPRPYIPLYDWFDRLIRNSSSESVDGNMRMRFATRRASWMLHYKPLEDHGWSSAGPPLESRAARSSSQAVWGWIEHTSSESMFRFEGGYYFRNFHQSCRSIRLQHC